MGGGEGEGEKGDFQMQQKGTFRIVINRLRRNKMAWIAMWIIIALAFFALFAGFISPYDYDEQNRTKSYHPSTGIHLIDAEGRFHLQPFVYNYNLVDPVFKRYEPDTSKRFPIYFFIKRDGGYRLFGTEDPSRIFLLGSDLHGRDLFTRLLYGARISLSISILGVLISFVLGLLMGGIAGYFGGKIDNMLMRFGEIIMAVPGIYLLLALRAIFPTSLSPVQVYFFIILIMSFIGWAGLARVIRGMVLSIKEYDFVTAAKAIGGGHLRIIVRHILPNTLSYTIIAMTLSVPGYIIGEAALSFLGLGIQEPYPSWGNMLSAAQSIRVLTSAPWILMPGIFISVTIICFNLLGDGLRDAFDPKATGGVEVKM